MLPALHTAIRDGMRLLADIGYIGAPNILLPVRKHPDLPQNLDADNQTYNTLLRCIRAMAERAMAELKQRWRALQYVTLSPNRIGPIAQAALVLNNIRRSGTLRKPQ
ncbi:transposase family protein [Streptomyces chartreusis]|uniref:transposase family protein n=1 Tax=Streptomyces chartreusis TaxID=1969 RepID=UPI0036816061